MHNFNTPPPGYGSYVRWKHIVTYLTLLAAICMLLVHARQLFALMQHYKQNQDLVTAKKQIASTELAIAREAEMLKQKRSQWAALQDSCPHSCCGPALFELLNTLENYTLKSAIASKQGSTIEIEIKKEQLPELEKQLETAPLSTLVQKIDFGSEAGSNTALVTIACAPRSKNERNP